ncbi:MAG: hypothetical protein M1814_006666 [Vezdaea aestivalis]|nr:MAG: hypothetical protein M1814_006666 [Vezdaea aestivalis]
MTQPPGAAQFGDIGGQPGEYEDQSGLPIEGSERGTRRRKLAGYLKAANELRQSYQQSYTASRAQRDLGTEDDDSGLPGAFPGAAIVRSQYEEMILFPSYARRHVKSTRRPRQSGGGNAASASATLEAGSEQCQDSFNDQLDIPENDSAVVDVDVRGWIYTPHRGPLNRKNRLMIGIARKLSGIPAPPEERDPTEDASQEGSTHQERAAARAAKREEEMVSREAESIERKGQGEAKVASQGGYSENPQRDADTLSVGSVGDRSGVSTPRSADKNHQPENPRHSLVEATLAEEERRVSRRSPWNQPAEMSATQLRTANAHLMARLKPFLSFPQTDLPITVFFYNDKSSQSRTVVTNEAGHFTVRAALDFVPTDVRVLASDTLSATEEVRIIEHLGVSLISDIDDTIKHSAVGSGAREIFRNTFIRELGDLTIDGVKEWYNDLYNLGVQIHYVSNSPWQLYPLISSYFALAGLPPGSFHLKQYSGMLQGIFEPVAERKKGTLEKILQDFPERKFFLVGDSGEADLEVYTEVVLANPGRIIGVYIRDITSPPSAGFFDSSMGPLKGEKKQDTSKNPTARDSGNTSSQPKPPQDKARVPAKPEQPTGPLMGRLIDFDDDSPNIQTSQPESTSALSDSTISSKPKATPPPRPKKPEALRSPSSNTLNSVNANSSPISSSISQSSASQPLPRTPRPPPPAAQQTPSDYDPQDSSRRTFLRQKLTSAYNSLPYIYNDPPTSDKDSVGSGARTPAGTGRSLASYPAAAASYANARLWGEGNGNTAGDDPKEANTKEELWKRRWARAREVLGEKGVELRSWRVGGDVRNDAVDLTERTLKDNERRSKK